MKRNLNISLTLPLIAVGLTLASCDSDVVSDNGGLHGDCISFGVSDCGSRADASGGQPVGSLILRSADGDSLFCSVSETEGIGTASGMSRGLQVGNATQVEGLGCFAYMNSVSNFLIYNKQYTRSSGSEFTAKPEVYWPGAHTDINFYLYSPLDATNLSVTVPAGGNKPVISYTVPSDATEQKDLMTAVEKNIAGNYNETLLVRFDHLMSAIKIVAAEGTQAGTLKNITITDVINKGEITIDDSPQWTLGSTRADVALGKDVSVTGNADQTLTDGEYVFMLLPQTLTDEMMLKVTIEADGQSRDLSVPLNSGTVKEWQMGRTYTYRLNIKPDYTFELTDENPELDAHYEIFKTTLKVSKLPAGKKWTVTASDGVTIMKQADLNDYAKQGYWTDRNKSVSISGNTTDTGSARGNSSFSGTGSGDIPIAVFVPENATDASREISLTVKVDGSNAVIKTFKLTQLAPAWNGNIGCERKEKDPCQWGFYWSDNFRIIYDLTQCDNASRKDIYDYISWCQTLKSLSESIIWGWLVRLLFGNNIPDLSFIDMDRTTTGDWWNQTSYANKITINLGEIATSGIALSPGDGQSNTSEIYNFNGLSLVTDIINRIENIQGYVRTTQGNGVFPSYNASIACMKLNSWDIVTSDSNTLLQLKTDKPVWYLPARNEAPLMVDNEYPLSGTYWTSTAEDNNQNAYIWTVGQSSASDVAQRDQKYNVRAVRSK